MKFIEPGDTTIYNRMVKIKIFAVSANEDAEQQELLYIVSRRRDWGFSSVV